MRGHVPTNSARTFPGSQLAREIYYRRGCLPQYEMAPSTAVLAQHAVDVPPVFLQGAGPDSRHGEQLLAGYRAAGGQSPEGAVAEDSERRQATPPGLDQTPDAQRRFEAGVHPGF